MVAPQVERARAAAAFAQGEVASDAARRAEEAEAGAERAHEQAVLWQVRCAHVALGLQWLCPTQRQGRLATGA